ncbi:MAG: YbaL family putative K(+) efflux transporter [Campylobacterales bacterium]
MEHELTLITTIAAAFGFALVAGFAAAKLKLPPLVGYLLAGVVIGPFTPGFVADAALSQQLAEIGVILLMFGVGLHFSVEDLLSVKRIALPGAIVQIGAATALGTGVATLWGWDLGGALIFGLALSVASTVVLIRALEDRGILESVNGRIAIGWLVVEDLVMVMVLVLLPPLAFYLGGTAVAEPAADQNLWLQLAITLGKVGVFIALILALGKRFFPWMLWQVAQTGSRELFTLCVIAAALGIAYLSAHFFDVSFALGAFFAGMVMRGSHLSHQAAERSLPLRDAFSVLFFVAVGMLFDPFILIQMPLHVLAVVLIIMLGKSIAAFLLVVAFRYPVNTALTVSASLAQIGEFSFILAGMGVAFGLLSIEGHSLILAGALISIALNPLIFKTIDPIQQWLRSRSKLACSLERPGDPLSVLPKEADVAQLENHVVLVGHGRVGARIATALLQSATPFVVVEIDREAVLALRRRGILALYGDVTDPATLVQAHAFNAKIVVIAMPDTFEAKQMIALAKELNPNVAIVGRTHTEEGAALLKSEGADGVFVGEQELAQSMVRFIFRRLEA